MKHGKKYTDSLKLIDANKQYYQQETYIIVLQTKKPKLKESIELSIR